MNERVQAGEGSDATEEHGVILAASLADRGLRTGQAVGLAVHGEELAWLPPRKGRDRLLEILHVLALVSRGPRPLAELLAQMEPTFGRYTSLVIITPATESAWVEALFPLCRRGVTPTVLLLDPRSFGGTGNLGAVRSLLGDMGVMHYVITRDVLEQPEARFLQDTRRTTRVRLARQELWRSLKP
jgi:uncharacterized protein (DUF58 family)